MSKTLLDDFFKMGGLNYYKNLIHRLHIIFQVITYGCELNGGEFGK